MIVLSQKKHSGLRTFNNVLTIIVVLLGVYIIVTPFLPRLTYWWQNRNKSANSIPYKSNLSENDQKDNSNLPNPPNRHLVIPSMNLDVEIFEGTSSSTLNKGVWRRPKTSTPDKGGNTVLVAHRFVYTGEAPFYHLDKVKKDDTFAVFWEGKEYNYKVREIKVVNPSAIEIENNTSESIITLYTCTPMWTAKQRLVVIANLTSQTTIQ